MRLLTHARTRTLLPLLLAPAFCLAVCARESYAQARRGGASQAGQTPARPGRAQARDETRASVLVAEGADALARGDEGSARDSFARALQSDPDNVDAHTYLGVLFDRAGDLKEAERHFAAAAAFAPFSASVRNNYGAVLVRVGRTQLAAAQFEASLKLDSAQPSALVNLAQIKFNSGKPEDLRAARDLFTRAHAVAPDAEIARALVVISLRLGERDAAAAAYREYSARAASSSASQTSSPTATPSSPDASSPASRATLGAALLEGGLVGEAVSELNAAVALDPSNVDALVALARAHLRLRDIKSAGRTLEAAVARGVADARVYAALADVYEAGGYVENAIPAMRLAIERDPRNESYRLRYGLLLNDTKAPAAAVIRLREALNEFPNSSPLWLALGIAQMGDGKSDDARKSFERALELDPRSAPALAYLGSTYGERGQYAEAASYYERAVNAAPGVAVPYYLAADALLKQPEVDAPRVERYLARAVELEPDFASAHMALAKLYVRGERWAEAAAGFERVTRLDPDSAEAHYQLGRVYVRLKRAAEAQRELDRFKQLSDAQKEKRETDRRDLLRRLANVRF
ncbi:MAG TPA: tetratricopeptide repeat protein [Pyrinomonadaceae bacterium]|jgi:Tfp pilus assembly protein PilF|nr:tetratricopeptide repeat protein [Pyrinomonadaceae bacterium]